MNIQQFGSDVLAQRADKIREYFHADAFVNWHCSNEHFTVEEFIRANCEYPGDWNGEVEKIVTTDDMIITATRVYPKDCSASFHVTSFIKLKDDKIVAMDEYWADDGEAPKVATGYENWEKDMEIKKLDRKMYEGRKFTLHYLTNGYYDIAKSNTGFQIEYKLFDKPTEMSFDDYFFNEWLEDPVAYGAFEDGQLLGYAEGTLEKWNNRYRISNICVFDDTQRHNGVGTALMNTILKEAKESGARMVVLETQTCNENAIAFYHKNGFDIIGFDLYAYTNTDPERHEIRIEMGKRL